MPYTIAEKLKIKKGYRLLTINAPKSFKEHLQPLPEDLNMSTKTKNFQQVHWFVNDRAQMEEELPEILELIGNEVTCWIYYPKGSSGIQTDLTRDKGWENLLEIKDLLCLILISFDDTWSAFGMRRKTEKDLKKVEKPKEREIFNYIDPVKKLIYLPEDFSKALNKAPDQKTFYESLSFTNRKEYLEWIVSAKKQETRETRINETISRLENKWKNPNNR